MKTKQGISLIVLVITIIVMVILAGAIILTLSNNGIISKASDAVDFTDISNMQDLATMLWAEEYLDSEGKATVEELKEAVITGLSKSDPDYAKRYNVDVTLKGVDVTWIYLNRPYIYIGTDENGNEIKEAYIFYPDGSVERYDSYGYINESFESGTCSYSSSGIVMGDKTFKFTNGKGTLVWDNKEYNAEYNLIHFFCEIDYNLGEDGKVMLFAEQGSTWKEFCNSSYNTGNYETEGKYVDAFGGVHIQKSKNDVHILKTDKIIKGHTYYYYSLEF